MPSPRSTHPHEALTPRQQEILDFIRNHLAESGVPPTRLEICAAFGFASPNAAEDHLGSHLIGQGSYRVASCKKLNET
jgi:SOS-response transcriptional repressor LexA